MACDSDLNAFVYACVCVHCLIINNMNWEQGTNGEYKKKTGKKQQQKTKKEKLVRKKKDWMLMLCLVCVHKFVTDFEFNFYFKYVLN